METAQAGVRAPGFLLLPHYIAVASRGRRHTRGTLAPARASVFTCYALKNAATGVNV